MFEKLMDFFMGPVAREKRDLEKDIFELKKKERSLQREIRALEYRLSALKGRKYKCTNKMN